METLISDKKLPPEKEQGNIEYKRQLCELFDWKMSKLASQMKWRLCEGEGNTIYYIGINDNGSIYGLNKEQMEESLNNIVKLVIEIKAIITDIKVFNIKDYGQVAKIIINEIPHWND